MQEIHWKLYLCLGELLWRCSQSFRDVFGLPPVYLHFTIDKAPMLPWRHLNFSKTWTTIQNEVKLILEGSFCFHKAKKGQKEPGAQP